MDWEAHTRLQDRVRVFDSDQHRKIRWGCFCPVLLCPAVPCCALLCPAVPCCALLCCARHGADQPLITPWLSLAYPLLCCSYYRAFADTKDDNGHGSHVAGTVAGLLAGTTLEEEVAKGANSSAGLAPGAKLAVFGACPIGSQRVCGCKFSPAKRLPARILTALCAAGGAVCPHSLCCRLTRCAPPLRADLGLGPGISFLLPSMADDYFGFTSAVGAMVHSSEPGVGTGQA